LCFFQSGVIRRNLFTFDPPKPTEAGDGGDVGHLRLQLLRHLVAQHFVQEYEIRNLPRQLRILPDVSDQAANDCMQVTMPLMG
jgi:hypothetical protein